MKYIKTGKKAIITASAIAAVFAAFALLLFYLFHTDLFIFAKVKPEAFTELYFADHLSLSKEVTIFKENNFEFVIHNLENQDMEYQYEVYLEKTGQDYNEIYYASSDGTVSYQDQDFEACRNAKAGSTVNTADSVDDDAASRYSYNEACVINRSFFGFDTSKIPDDAIITETALLIYGYGNADSYVCAMKGTQNDNLDKSDFDSFTGAVFGHVLWKTAAYNKIIFNQAGIAGINKTGITRICCREFSHDYSGNPAPSNFNCGFYFSETVEPGKKPFLAISYSDPDINEKKQSIEKGSVSVKKDEYKIISVDYKIPAPLKSGKVVVNLVNKNQSISFWIEDTSSNIPDDTVRQT